jgi:hypothetical protein
MPYNPNSNSNTVTYIPGQPLNQVAQPAWMTAAGLTNGIAIQDIRLSYDKATDTLAVGVNFYGIAGDTDGTPNGGTNPLTTAAGGSNPPHLSGGKSITIALAPNTPAGANANPVVVAGVPANKSNSPAGSLDGFNVASVNTANLGPNGSNIQNAYGTTLTANLGALAYDPSSAHPGFEFTIKNFSKIPGLNALTNGFYISAYSGTGSTIIVGKSAVAPVFIAALQEPGNLNPPPPAVTPPSVPQVHTPEPSTLLAWGLVAGGAGWRFRRRLRPIVRS